MQGAHLSSLNACSMHAQPIHANYHLKPVKLIHYRKSVGFESNILFYIIFFSFAAATSLVSEANKLSEKRFSTSQNFTIFET